MVHRRSGDYIVKSRSGRTEKCFQTQCGSPVDCTDGKLRWSGLLQQTTATRGEEDRETVAPDGVRARAMCWSSPTDGEI